jgi:mevalonate kinase
MPVITLLYFGIKNEKEKVAGDSRARIKELNNQISQLLTENGILEREVRKLTQEKRTLISQMELMKERLSRLQDKVVSDSESESEKEKIRMILEKAREFEFNL